MGVRESLLNTITSVADSDFVRIVTSAGASSKATVKNLFKGFESNLGAKSSLTTSDYIRVVGSDNEAYKQSISSMKTAMGIDALNNKLNPETYTLTKTSNIGTFEYLCIRSGNIVSGYVVFAPTATLGNDFIVNGLPSAYGGQQMPLICVAGSADQKGLVGRVRVNGDALQIWYSNITPISGNTYLIPVNYICS